MGQKNMGERAALRRRGKPPAALAGGGDLQGLCCLKGEYSYCRRERNIVICGRRWQMWYGRRQQAAGPGKDKGKEWMTFVVDYCGK